MLSSSDLENHLTKQITMLGKFCEDFDNGYEEIAIHIAVILRILFHDTSIQGNYWDN
jgi:hypothetical protein